MCIYNYFVLAYWPLAAVYDYEVKLIRSHIFSKFTFYEVNETRQPEILDVAMVA
jgi:hypothetical protein